MCTTWPSSRRRASRRSWWASSEFVDAARRQSAALGMPGIAERAVYVPHPIQDATDDEIRGKARAAIDAILNAITT